MKRSTNKILTLLLGLVLLLLPALAACNSTTVE